MQRAQSKPRIAGNELVFMTDEEMKNEKAERGRIARRMIQP